MLVTLDYETFFDTKFSLRTHPTSEYVRNKQFEALSCSIKKDDNKTVCYFGKDIQPALDDIDWANTTLLAHHTHFDGLILSHHFGKVPKTYACTMSMARALHPKMERASLDVVALKYGKTNKLTMPDFKGKHLADLSDDERKAIANYNIVDVDACYEIYQEMLKCFPKSELELIDITVRMFAAPVLRVDMSLARKELKEEQTRKQAAIDKSGMDPKDLASNRKFVEALKELEVEIPMKPSPSVPGKVIPAVAKSDEALQALLLHPKQEVVDLVAARLAVKSTIGETRAARMIERGRGGMRLPIYLNYALAHTLRWTGGDKFNPQNFKQSAKVGGKLREAILAPANHKLVVVDAAQIEARIVSWLAGAEKDLDAFRNGRDLYCEFASLAYGRQITKADKEERFVGKTCKLGLGFQMGGPKLQTTILVQSINQGLDPIRLPLEVCYRLVNIYRESTKEIPELWEYMNNVALKAMIIGKRVEYKCVTFDKECIELPNGLKLHYPEIKGNIVKASRMFSKKQTEIVQDASYLSRNGRSHIYGGLLTENVVQALARIFVSDVMRAIAKEYRVVLMTHDEIVFAVPNKRAKDALAWAIKLMSTPPAWALDLPLSAEGGYDTCYSK